MANGPTRIDPTPARISTNISIDRQTPKTGFGDRLKAGIDTVGSGVASAAAMVGNALPGGAIISAAVSSVGTLSSHGTPGGAAVSSAYGGSGVIPVGMGGAGGGTNTTLPTGPAGMSGMPGVGGSGGGYGGSSGTSVPSPGSTSGDQIGNMNAQMVQAQSDNAKLLNVQISMQRENQVYTAVSNVLKTRHDTVKNAIGNIR